MAALDRNLQTRTLKNPNVLTFSEQLHLPLNSSSYLPFKHPVLKQYSDSIAMNSFCCIMCKRYLDKVPSLQLKSHNIKNNGKSSQKCPPLSSC